MKKYIKRIISILLTCFVICSIFYNSIIFTKAETTFDAQLSFTSIESNIQAECVEFAKKVTGIKDLSNGKSLKVYDTYSNPLGYCISLYSKEVPYGFIIIDPRSENGIVEYSLNVNEYNPFEAICKKNNITLEDEESTHYIIGNNYAYYVIDNDFTRAYTYDKSYEIKDFNKNIMNNTLLSSDKKTSAWSDLIKASTTFDYEAYTIERNGSVPNYYVLTEDEAKQKTGHFACCASSMYICAALLSRVNENEFDDDYMALWDYSDTSVESVKNGVTYGLTSNQKVGPGLVSFLRSKGVDNVSYEFKSDPDISFFVNAVDELKVSIVCTTLNTSLGKKGHAVAVEGYIYFRNNNNGSTMRCLCVANTWDSYLCYYNYDYPVIHRDGICIDGAKVVSPY